MKEVLKELGKYPVTTRLSLNGTIIVARDIAHAKLKERLEKGEGLPQYMKDHPVYYAGPAKTPEGYPSGSFGPTTAGRHGFLRRPVPGKRRLHDHDCQGQPQPTGNGCLPEARRLLPGLHRRPAAILAKNNIKKVELLEYPELGMEAIWKIEVEDFPAFILVDDKGNDFLRENPRRMGLRRLRALSLTRKQNDSRPESFGAPAF